jgi:hypothetical protein
MNSWDNIKANLTSAENCFLSDSEAAMLEVPIKHQPRYFQRLNVGGGYIDIITNKWWVIYITDASFT